MQPGVVDMPQTAFVDTEDIDELMPMADVLRCEGLARVDRLRRSLVETIDAQDEIHLAGDQLGLAHAVKGTVRVDWMEQGPAQREHRILVLTQPHRLEGDESAPLRALRRPEHP